MSAESTSDPQLRARYVLTPPTTRSVPARSDPAEWRQRQNRESPAAHDLRCEAPGVLSTTSLPTGSVHPLDNTVIASPDFSLVSGGPLFQLLRRMHLSGDALELTRQRLLVVVLVAWLPLL